MSDALNFQRRKLDFKSVCKRFDLNICWNCFGILRLSSECAYIYGGGGLCVCIYMHHVYLCQFILLILIMYSFNYLSWNSMERLNPAWISPWSCCYFEWMFWILYQFCREIRYKNSSWYAGITALNTLPRVHCNVKLSWVLSANKVVICKGIAGLLIYNLLWVYLGMPQTLK